MRTIRKIYRKIRRMYTWYGVHNRFKKILQYWREHGSETFLDTGVIELKNRLVKNKALLGDLFEPYNVKYCGTCNGACCYPLWGAFTATEFAVMEVSERTQIHRLMEKKNDKIKELWDKNQCMFWRPEKGCKLPLEMRSIICVTHICPIFRNVIQGENMDLIKLVCKETIGIFNELADRVNEIRREHGLPEFTEYKRSDDSNVKKDA